MERIERKQAERLEKILASIDKNLTRIARSMESLENSVLFSEIEPKKEDDNK